MTNWTPCFNSNKGFRCARYANNIWVACRTNSQYETLYWSLDGKTWTESTSIYDTGAYNVYVYDVCYANGMWVVASSDGIYRATDGKNWTKDSTGFVSNSFSKVYYANGIWYICFTNGGMAYADDSNFHWTGCSTESQADMSTTPFFKVCYAKDKWFACSSTNGLWTSTNGKTNWYKLTSSEINKVADFIYANDLFIVCGQINYSTTHASIRWSRSDYFSWRNGIGTWYEESHPIGENTTTLCYAKGILLAGIDSGLVSSGVIGSFGTLTNNVAQILDWLLYAVDNLLN